MLRQCLPILKQSVLKFSIWKAGRDLAAWNARCRRILGSETCHATFRSAPDERGPSCTSGRSSSDLLALPGGEGKQVQDPEGSKQLFLHQSLIPLTCGMSWSCVRSSYPRGGQDAGRSSRCPGWLARLTACFLSPAWPCPGLALALPRPCLASAPA